MCIKCDQYQSEVSLLSQAEIEEHHFDLLLELSDIARDMAERQARLLAVAARIGDVELEMQSRESKKDDSIN
jgi:hypothetical protein